MTSILQVQRTPINHNRPAVFQQGWPQQSTSMRAQQHRGIFRTGSISENSENEVDNILGQRRVRKPVNPTMHTGYINSRDESDQRGTFP